MCSNCSDPLSLADTFFFFWNMTSEFSTKRVGKQRQLTRAGAEERVCLLTLAGVTPVMNQDSF
jgi:hypothetical protein